ncbi:MAG: hypothetical protein LC749_07425 [Actinobacteria bacterium]|nr:hypothetical protein [Actinomycetota bacterium]
MCTVDGLGLHRDRTDLHSRNAIGYAVADRLRTSLIIEALTARIAQPHIPNRRSFPQRQ